MAYQTTPGTLPHKVVEYLRAHPGQEFATAVLCDEFQTDATSFAKSMENPKKHGMVRCRRKPQHGLSFWWSIGDGQPALPHDFEPDAPLGNRTTITVRPGPLLPGVDTSKAKEKPEVEVPTFTGWAGKAPAAAEAEEEPDALLSCRTGAITLVGVKPDARGRVVVPAALVECIKRRIAWGPAA